MIHIHSGAYANFEILVGNKSVLFKKQSGNFFCNQLRNRSMNSCKTKLTLRLHLSAMLCHLVAKPLCLPGRIQSCKCRKTFRRILLQAENKNLRNNQMDFISANSVALSQISQRSIRIINIIMDESSSLGVQHRLCQQ